MHPFVIFWSRCIQNYCTENRFYSFFENGMVRLKPQNDTGKKKVLFDLFRVDLIASQKSVEAEKTLDDLGMNVADAVTIFLKQVVLTESIPFEIKKPKYNQETVEAIKEALDIIKNPENYKSFNSVDELMEELNSEDE